MSDIRTSDYVTLTEDQYDKAYKYIPSDWTDIILAKNAGVYSFDGAVTHHTGNLMKLTDAIAAESFCGTNDRNFVIASVILLIITTIHQIMLGIDVFVIAMCLFVIGIMGMLNIIYSRWELERFRTAMGVIALLTSIYENSISKEIITLQDSRNPSNLRYQERYNSLYALVQQKAPKLLLTHTQEVRQQEENIALDILK